MTFGLCAVVVSAVVVAGVVVDEEEVAEVAAEAAEAQHRHCRRSATSQAAAEAVRLNRQLAEVMAAEMSVVAVRQWHRRLRASRYPNDSFYFANGN